MATEYEATVRHTAPNEDIIQLLYENVSTRTAEEAAYDFLRDPSLLSLPNPIQTKAEFTLLTNDRRGNCISTSEFLNVDQALSGCRRLRSCPTPPRLQLLDGHMFLIRVMTLQKLPYNQQVLANVMLEYQVLAGRRQQLGRIMLC